MLPHAQSTDYSAQTCVFYCFQFQNKGDSAREAQGSRTRQRQHLPGPEEHKPQTLICSHVLAHMHLLTHIHTPAQLSRPCAHAHLCTCMRTLLYTLLHWGSAGPRGHSCSRTGETPAPDPSLMSLEGVMAEAGWGLPSSAGGPMVRVPARMAPRPGAQLLAVPQLPQHSLEQASQPPEHAGRALGPGGRALLHCRPQLPPQRAGHRGAAAGRGEPVAEDLVADHLGERGGCHSSGLGWVGGVPPRPVPPGELSRNPSRAAPLETGSLPRRGGDVAGEAAGDAQRPSRNL